MMPPLDGPELIRRAAARDAVLRRTHASLRHDEGITTESLDAGGRLLTRSSARRLGVASGESAGAVGTLAADRNESATIPASSFAAVVDLAKLAGRFELAREPDGAAADGRPCFVVAFRPRAVPQPYNNREEMVVNQLAGRFWLSQEDLAIVQSEGALTRPVKVAWVASVYRLSFAYRTQVLAGAPGSATTVPASFVLDLGIRAPLYHARQRQTTTMTAFR